MLVSLFFPRGGSSPRARPFFTPFSWDLIFPSLFFSRTPRGVPDERSGDFSLRGIEFFLYPHSGWIARPISRSARDSPPLSPRILVIALSADIISAPAVLPRDRFLFFSFIFFLRIFSRPTWVAMRSGEADSVFSPPLLRYIV